MFAISITNKRHIYRICNEFHMLDKDNAILNIGKLNGVYIERIFKLSVNVWNDAQLHQRQGK